MTKIVKLVGVLVLAFVLTGCDKIEIYKQYWDKDEKMLRAELPYKKTDKLVYFYFCGQNVKDHKQILGKAKCYFENGQLRHEVEFADDGNGGSMKVGVERIYYNNGQIRYEHPFNAKGEKDGVAKYWYENGQLILELSYNNGKRDLLKIYDYNSNTTKETNKIVGYETKEYDLKDIYLNNWYQ